MIDDYLELNNGEGEQGMVVVIMSALPRGYLTEDTLGLIHQKMSHEFTLFGVRIDGIYYYPHNPDEKCIYRKPEMGLFHRAADEMVITIADSFVVSGTQMDIGIDKALNYRMELVTTGPIGGSGVTDKLNYTVDSLLETAWWIVTNSRRY